MLSKNFLSCMRTKIIWRVANALIQNPNQFIYAFHFYAPLQKCAWQIYPASSANAQRLTRKRIIFSNWLTIVLIEICHELDMLIYCALWLTASKQLHFAFNNHLTNPNPEMLNSQGIHNNQLDIHFHLIVSVYNLGVSVPILAEWNLYL